MQNYTSISDSNEHLPLIRSSRDLAQSHGNYFIFCDKVYDINRVITSHPGGFDVIDYVRGK
jgi:cytochrome b involved in lipid metabolism